MSHTDYIDNPPEKFNIVSNSKVCPVAAMENKEDKLYGVQFHPEVMHSVEGSKMLKTFFMMFVDV